MSKTIVSILSDHLLPNFLFIKEMEHLVGDLLLITTPQMEEKGRGSHLEKALGREAGSLRRIVVENDNYKEILRTLTAAQIDKAEEYIINITGGTKTMSLAVHEFFRDFNASFVYVPIGKNSYYDFATDQIKPLSYRVSLAEYFDLYGLGFQCDNALSFGSQRPFDLFNQQKNRSFRLSREILDAHEARLAEERHYLGGSWFEEYTYLRIKHDFNLRDVDIAKSIRIYRSGSTSNDNELDVAFVRDNTLYVIECKVSMWGYGKDSKDIVEEYLYKLAAISKDFGLHVNSYIFTLHQMHRFSSVTRANMDKRMRILGIRGIIDGPKLMQTLKL